MRKAMELSVLCDCDVGLIVFGPPPTSNTAPPGSTALGTSMPGPPDGTSPAPPAGSSQPGTHSLTTGTPPPQPDPQLLAGQAGTSGAAAGAAAGAAGAVGPPGEVVILSSSGRQCLYQFSSCGMEELLERYAAAVAEPHERRRNGEVRGALRGPACGGRAISPSQNVLGRDSVRAYRVEGLSDELVWTRRS